MYKFIYLISSGIRCGYNRRIPRIVKLYTVSDRWSVNTTVEYWYQTLMVLVNLDNGHEWF